MAFENLQTRAGKVASSGVFDPSATDHAAALGATLQGKKESLLSRVKALEERLATTVERLDGEMVANEAYKKDVDGFLRKIHDFVGLT